MHIDAKMDRPLVGISHFPRRHQWLVPLLLLVVGMGLVIAAYLQYALWHGEAQSPAPRQWPGSKITLLQGQGRADGDAIIATTLPDSAMVMGVIRETNFTAKHYTDVVWRVADVPQEAEILVAWQRRDENDEWHYKPLNKDRNDLARTTMVAEPSWSGEIVSIGLVIGGDLPSPVRIDRVILEPGSAGSVLRGLTSGWFAPEPWNQGSINFIHGGMPNLSFTLLSFVAAGLGVAVALAWLLAVVPRPPSRIFVIGALVVMAWLLTDARWQWNLWAQLGATGRQFAGATWEQKHRFAEDGELFRFIQEVKAKLPPPPVRILYFAGEPYLNGRGNYHLYPHNVFSYNHGGVGSVPPPQQFRVGDYVVLYRQASVNYDLQQGVLSWNGGQRRAELIYASDGNMLLKVI